MHFIKKVVSKAKNERIVPEHNLNADSNWRLRDAPCAFESGVRGVVAKAGVQHKIADSLKNDRDSEGDRGRERLRTPEDDTRVIRVSSEHLLKQKIFAISEKHAVSDEFKLLRTRIMQQIRPQGLNTILVTGFGPSDGKSTIAVNLAVSISKDLRQTTLLADLDFRDPDIQKIFGLDEEMSGLKDYFLNGTRLHEIFINPGIEKLRLLPAGGKVENAPEILGSPKMEKLVKELKLRYSDRIIIFDSPAVTVCPDSLIFSEYVDAILLVVRSSKTSRDEIREGLKLLPEEKIIGMVFNDAKVA